MAVPRALGGALKNEIPFDEVARLWEAVADLEPEARAEALDAACRDRPALRAEIESLLAAEDQAGSFLEQPPPQGVAQAGTLALASGTVLGTYVIVEPLGVGGMGEVYRATDPRLGRDLALKILSRDSWSDRRALSRFEREARAASALNHPAIVQIYEVGSAAIAADGLEQSVPYIAMELVRGQTFRRKLEEGCDPATLLRWLVAVARGLAVAHDAGIVHRDLKPENIMIDDAGFPKILDFGLAKLVEGGGPGSTATREGMVMGTAGYMSPEQVQGAPVDGRSDVFSFGCILHEAASGSRPFDAHSLVDTLHHIVHRPAPRIEREGRRASRALQRIVDRCLAKAPGDRYASMHEVADALDAVLAADDIVGLPKWLKATAAIASIAAVVVALFMVWPERSADRPPPSPAASVRSVAMTPFVAQAPSDRYLADGIAERLSDHLRYAAQINVITPAGPAGGGRPAADAVIGGKIERSGDRLRVALEIARRSTGERRREVVERRLDEIPALQQEILLRVASVLGLSTEGVRSRALVRNETSNPKAYDLFLKGRAAWNLWTKEGFEQAVRHFEEALLHDPLFANAHAGISDSYAQLALYNYQPPREAWPKAKAAALKAVSLDPALGEAHMSLAVVMTWFDWDFDAAERQYREAVRLSPRSPEVHLAYGFHLGVLGRFDEMSREMERARDLNPASVIAGFAVADAMMLLRDKERHLAETGRLAAMYPEVANTGFVHGLALQTAGRHHDAFREFLRYERLSGATPQTLARLERAYRSGGIRAYWRAAAGSYVESERVALDVAQAWALAGDADRAIAALERGMERRDAFILWARSYPMFDFLSQDPRYQRLLRTIFGPA